MSLYKQMLQQCNKPFFPAKSSRSTIITMYVEDLDDDLPVEALCILCCQTGIGGAPSRSRVQEVSRGEEL
jgi:hypothetical protein